MGGRGSSGGGSNGVFGKSKPITVETRYIEGRGWHRGRYVDTVLQAVSTGGGKKTKKPNACFCMDTKK